MSLTDELEFVAFDLETTGLSPAFHRIVECGAVRFRADGTELNRMTQLVDNSGGMKSPRRRNLSGNELI